MSHVIILGVGYACIMVSVLLILLLGAEDHDPLLSPAFMSLGLTFVYAGSLVLVKPEAAARFMRGSRLDWVPIRIRGGFLVVFGTWWALVGLANLFSS